MKRLKSSDEIDSYGCERNWGKDVSNSVRSSSSSHRNAYHKSGQENAVSRKGTVSPSRYDRERPPFSTGDDICHRDGSRGFLRKRSFHGFDGGIENRRQGGDNRHADERIYRSDSFCLTRREFPKGFRSERERPRRDGGVSSSWRRFGGRVREFGVDERERGGSLRVVGRDREREKEKERIVKSPSWSRDSGSEQSRARGVVGADSRDSRSRSKSKSSPAWSKDSESEQSKSVGDVVKKSEDLLVKNGSSSEMEEGELEPEHLAEPKSNNVANQRNEIVVTDNSRTDMGAAVVDSEKDKPCDGSNCKIKEAETEGVCRDIQSETKVLKTRDVKEMECKETAQGERCLLMEENGDLHAAEVKSEEAGKTDACGVEAKDDVEIEHTKENELSNERLESEVDDRQKICEEMTNTAEDEDDSWKIRKETTNAADETVCLEKAKPDDVIKHETKLVTKEMSDNKLACSEHQEEGTLTMNLVAEGANRVCIDKGKKLAAIDVESDENGMWTDQEARDLSSRDSDGIDFMEGPSTRGFELFSTSPVRKPDKERQSENHKDHKLKLEPLDLSLSLPDVLLPLGEQDVKAAAVSPTGGTSIQSFTDTYYTQSDAFTASFSGSQSFHHNPSCSLNNNSLDNCEQSVHSRPIFQGIDQNCGAWQAQTHNDPHIKEASSYQRLLINGNGPINQNHVLLDMSSSQAIQGQHLRVPSNGLERQLSIGKPNDVKASNPSMDSYESGSSYCFEKKGVMKEKYSSGFRSSRQKETGLPLVGGSEFFENLVNHMVTDPIHVMAKTFHEMADKYKKILKESIRQMMLNTENLSKLHVIKSALRKRRDITMEVLLKSHRVQLEILVALRTGLPEYLGEKSSLSSSDLAEIFLNLRCRNPTCKSQLPVDECDCKVCSKKDGFCSACMCLVCGKYDMSFNTCSWVGCDVCLHWCHVDCALRASYIRSGNNNSGVQFYCVCDHPSEMFGFVKEVFQNFAKGWNRENLCRELEYVRRIFSSSRDLMGIKLVEMADKMLTRLANDCDLSEVCNYVCGFLADCDSSNRHKVPVLPGQERAISFSSVGNAGPSQDASWVISLQSDQRLKLERSSSSRSLNGDLAPSEFQRSSPHEKEPIFEELDSIIRIKEAEARMFQCRADDARREAERLKRVADANNKKIDDEYKISITNLHLAEAEEARNKKLGELQALERSHRDYFSMKMRMEEDIKDLLRKMESTRRNLAL